MPSADAMHQVLTDPERLRALERTADPVCDLVYERLGGGASDDIALLAISTRCDNDQVGRS